MLSAGNDNGKCVNRQQEATGKITASGGFIAFSVSFLEARRVSEGKDNVKYTLAYASGFQETQDRK